MVSRVVGQTDFVVCAAFRNWKKFAVRFIVLVPASATF